TAGISEHAENRSGETGPKNQLTQSTARNVPLMHEIPLLIDFVAPSSLFREDNRVSPLPIVGNGPPGTFVVVANIRISLPTDQIVIADDSAGYARVGFGG